jgi:hypothetical protein
MFPRFLVAAVLAAGLLAIPGGVPVQADPPKPGDAPATGARKIVSILHNQRVTFDADLTQVSLSELLNTLAKKYEVNIVVREEAFREAGVEGVGDRKPQLGITRMGGLTLHRFLTLCLGTMGAVPMVRDDYIEIVPREAALKEAGLIEAVHEANISGDPEAVNKAQARLGLPLVNVVVENQPLPAVFGELARVYDLNIVTDARTQKDVRGVVLSERLLNVPADTALELLAGQAGLAVVRKGNTFRVTAGEAR